MGGNDNIVSAIARYLYPFPLHPVTLSPSFSFTSSLIIFYFPIMYSHPLILSSARADIESNYDGVNSNNGVRIRNYGDLWR